MQDVTCPHKHHETNEKTGERFCWDCREYLPPVEEHKPVAHKHMLRVLSDEPIYSPDNTSVVYCIDCDECFGTLEELVAAKNRYSILEANFKKAQAHSLEVHRKENARAVETEIAKEIAEAKNGQLLAELAELRKQQAVMVGMAIHQEASRLIAECSKLTEENARLKKQIRDLEADPQHMGKKRSALMAQNRELQDRVDALYADRINIVRSAATMYKSMDTDSLIKRAETAERRYEHLKSYADKCRKRIIGKLGFNENTDYSWESLIQFIREVGSFSNSEVDHMEKKLCEIERNCSELDRARANIVRDADAIRKELR